MLDGVHKGTVVQCWNNCDVGEIASKGHPVVFSRHQDFYLDVVSGSCSDSVRQAITEKKCLWTDIAAQMRQHPSKPELSLLLGGSAAMWTDEYCPHSECVGHPAHWGGKSGWLFEEGQDVAFARAFTAVVFPRLALVAVSETGLA